MRADPAPAEPPLFVRELRRGRDLGEGETRIEAGADPGDQSGHIDFETGFDERLDDPGAAEHGIKHGAALLP